MKTALKIFLGLVILGIFAYTIYFLYQKSEEKPVVWETATPVIADIVQKTVATGSVVPRKEIEIKPQVSGIIQELFVEPGDVVEEGALIARIKIIPDMVSLNNAENRLNQAQISLRNAQREFNRMEQLYQQQAVSQAEYQQAEIALQQAEEELETAESNLQLIQEGTTAKSAQTSNTLVRATISGMVLDVPVEEGNNVIESNTFNEGTTIATIANMNEMVFEGFVDESEVGKLQTGMELILTIGAIEGEQFPARLEYIAPKGVDEEGAVQFEIRAALEQEDTTSAFIRANYSANADIVLARRESVLALNESLLQFEDRKPYVEVEVQPQTFEKEYVELGLSDGIMVELLSDDLDTATAIKNPNLREGGA